MAKSNLSKSVQMTLHKQSAHNLLLALPQGASSLVPAIYQSSNTLLSFSLQPIPNNRMVEMEMTICEFELHNTQQQDGRDDNM